MAIKVKSVNGEPVVYRLHEEYIEQTCPKGRVEKCPFCPGQLSGEQDYDARGYLDILKVWKKLY